MFVGCNRQSQPAQEQTAQKPAPQPPPAVAKPPDFEFEPLIQADVDLYLGIMREADQRFKALPPEDKKVLADEASYYAHLKSGWHPDPTPPR